MSSSPGPGVGVSTETSSSTSGPPLCSYRTRRIAPPEFVRRRNGNRSTARDHTPPHGVVPHLTVSWQWRRAGVVDPDALFARATAAGAEVVRDLRDEDYGSRGFTVRDPEGNLWSFGTYWGA
ncbi:VOC family protein [Nocardia sp. 004]|uniref:VOC family protein n=1 Tax=Nocardia sp. 004 TaxID=3385978 RepID=UPI0039A30A90